MDHETDDYDVANLTHQQRIRYHSMRRAGESRNMALILASRKFPATNTDVEFNRGRCNGNQFENVPMQGDHLRAVADAAGVSTTGKWYCSGLADYPGDPTAWVADRHDVLAMARAKNCTVHGAVEHAGHEVESMPDVDVAPDIMDQDLEWWDERSGGQPMRPEQIAEAREDLLALRSGRVDPNEPLVSDPTEHYF